MKFHPSKLFLPAFIAIVAMIPASVMAQTVGISGSAITPNANSILELRSTDKGVLLPRMTTAERDAYTTSASLAAVDKGMTLFNTTTDTYEYWNGSAWVSMGTAGDYDDDWTVVGADVERQSGDVYIGDAASTNNDLYISDDIIDWDNSTYFLDPSSTSRINKIEFSDASTSSPAIQFEGDANSGLYQPADNEVGIVASGNERLRVVGTGVTIGGNADAPNSMLDIVGGTSGAVTNLMTVRSDFTANNTGSAMRLINSTSATSDVGAELQALTTDAANGYSSLVMKVHGSGGASGDLEERLRINGDGEMIIGSNGYRGKLTFYAEQGGTDYGVTFAANPATTQNVSYTLPADDGDSDDVLRTDGSGILTWVDPSTLSDGDWAVSGVDQYSEVSGNVGIGATAPYSKLEVYDASGPTVTITKDGADASAIFFRNGTGGGVNDGSTIGLNTAEHLDFTNSITDKDMFFNVNVGGTPTDVLFVDGGTGRIGINNTAPDYDLEVGGDAGIDNSLFHNGDPNTYMSFTTDRIQMFAGVGSSSPIIDIQETSGTDELTINEGGLQWDFRVEGGNDENLIFTDGSADKVGVGTSSPTAKFEVQEDANADPFIVRVRRENSIAGDLSGIGLGVQATTSVVKSGLIHERENSNGAGKLHLVVDDSNDANDVTLAESRITINQSGNVGVGTTDPTDQLDVDGQIRMRTGATNGYIPVSDANGVMTWTDPSTTVSGDFIQNQTGSNQAASFQISGTGEMDGGLTVGAGITVDDNNINVGTVATGAIAFGNASGEGIGSKRNAGGNQNGLDFYTNSINRVAISNAGNVGIGGTTPIAKLDVEGNLAVNDNQIRLRDGADANHYVGYLGGSVDGPKIQGFGGIVFSTATGAAQDVAFFSQDYAYFGFDPGSCCNGFEKVKVGRGRNADGTLEFMNNGWGRLGATNGLSLWADGNADVNDNPQMHISQAGNVGVGTTTPGAKLDVVGKTETDQLQVGNAGDTFSTMQAGTATLGGGSNVAVYTVNFNSAFASAPKVICTVRTQTGQSYNDTFAVTTKNIGTNNFQVNVVRVDGGGSGWGQTLLLDWMAIQ